MKALIRLNISKTHFYGTFAEFKYYQVLVVTVANVSTRFISKKLKKQFSRFKFAMKYIPFHFK